jgi:hypothetical protein
MKEKLTHMDNGKINEECQQYIAALEEDLRRIELENFQLEMQVFHLSEIKRLRPTSISRGWRRYRYQLFPAGSRMERWAKRFYHALKNLGR